MLNMRSVFAAAAASALLALSATAAANPPVTKSGDILVNQAGMTLYTFDKDPDGKSVCNAQCAALWPPVAAGADARPAGAYSIVTRDDGSKQWAYRGKPLYLWVKDQKPGDRTGDGVGGIWRLAKE